MTTHHFSHKEVKAVAEKLSNKEVYLPDVFEAMPSNPQVVFYLHNEESLYSAVFVRRDMKQVRSDQWEETPEEVAKRQRAFNDFPYADVWLIGEWKVYFSVPSEVLFLLKEFHDWVAIPFFPDFVDREWPCSAQHPMYLPYAFKHIETRLKWV